MKIVSCIICPNSCTIQIDEKTLEATGNRCPRGLEFAKQEITNPQRSVTSTIRTTFKDFPVLPCKTNKPVAKAKVMEVIKVIKETTVSKRFNVGDVIISNIADTGADLIATSNINEER